MLIEIHCTVVRKSADRDADSPGAYFWVAPQPQLALVSEAATRQNVSRPHLDLPHLATATTPEPTIMPDAALHLVQLHDMTLTPQGPWPHSHPPNAQFRLSPVPLEGGVASWLATQSHRKGP